MARMSAIGELLAKRPVDAIAICKGANPTKLAVSTSSLFDSVFDGRVLLGFVSDDGCVRAEHAIPMPVGSSSLDFVSEDVLAVGGDDGIVRIISTSCARRLTELVEHDGAITCVRTAPDDGTRIASCGSDAQLKLWSLARPEAADQTIAADPSDPLVALRFVGPVCVLCASRHGAVCVWDVRAPPGARCVVRAARLPAAAGTARAELGVASISALDCAAADLSAPIALGTDAGLVALFDWRLPGGTHTDCAGGLDAGRTLAPLLTFAAARGQRAQGVELRAAPSAAGWVQRVRALHFVSGADGRALAAASGSACTVHATLDGLPLATYTHDEPLVDVCSVPWPGATARAEAASDALLLLGSVDRRVVTAHVGCGGNA